MRLQFAIGASLLIHGVLLALPSGEFSPFDHRATNSHSAEHRLRQGTPAPITVTLGPKTIQTAHGQLQSSLTASIDRPAAPAIDTTASEFPKHATLDDEHDDSGPIRSQARFGIPAPEDYLGTNEVTEHPQLLSSSPEIPDDPVALPGSGSLVIRLWLNEDGFVDRCEVVSAQVDPKLKEAVVRQFRQLRFSPALRGDRAVKSRIKLRVDVLPPTSGPTAASAGGS